MAILPKPKPKPKPHIGIGKVEPKIVSKQAGLQESKLKIFDVPVALLVGHEHNPNEQSERTFDQIVERIRTEGFDEPIHVIPQLKNGAPTGKFLIFSGHHRVKAAKMLGLQAVPAVIREGWDEDRIEIELVSRNQLRGNMNPAKFTEMYDRLKKRYDAEFLKQAMGLTDKKAFNQLYKQMRDQLPEKAKAKLDEAKETITSVEDLSSVLNTIFKNHGSEVDHSFMVLSYGGKKHHYIQIDANTHKLVEALRERSDKDGFSMGKLMHDLLNDSVRVDNVISGMKTDA